MNFRRVLSIAALLVLAWLFVVQVRLLLADDTIWPPDDFVEYWAAAKLTLRGQNAYDPQLLFPLQQTTGNKSNEVVMMWNPPWVLTLVLPLGLLPARDAQFVWLAINFLALVYSGDRLWLGFGGSPRRRWVGGLIVFSAMPTLFALQSGQIGPLLLLGAVLFLDCQRRGWQCCAGAATVLLGIKPHLAYLVWLAILVDAVANRRCRVLLGGMATGSLCTLIALLFNHHILTQYADAMGNRPPSQWISPTLGTLLRLVFGENLFRLQFIPVLFGLSWFVWRYLLVKPARLASRSNWDWREQIPLLLLVSFVTAPYGAWPFDMVLLLPAVMWIILGANARMVHPPRVDGACELSERSRENDRISRVKRRLVLAGLVVVNLGCLVLNILHITSVWFLWVSPVLLALYALSRRAVEPALALKTRSIPTSARALVTA